MPNSRPLPRAALCMWSTHFRPRKASLHVALFFAPVPSLRSKCWIINLWGKKCHWQHKFSGIMEAVCSSAPKDPSCGWRAPGSSGCGRGTSSALGEPVHKDLTALSTALGLKRRHMVQLSAVLTLALASPLHPLWLSFHFCPIGGRSSFSGLPYRQMISERVLRAQ